MARNKKAMTIGQLRRTSYQSLSVRQEIRRNLIIKLRDDQEVFPGIVGFEDTVIPQLQKAILAGQDLILLGERGQAKTRLLRGLVNLLDEEIPCIADCEIFDNPYQPICRGCKDKVSNDPEGVVITWIPRDVRYSEKLATPDISIADIIGEVDPIKVAEGRYLSDELTIHYGLIPRTNRGIFCINELPDLPERVQVGMFNLMEERDIQIKGYRIRIPLDIVVVATANPEDYTNRGRIITPLKDRYGCQIRTHYPPLIEQEIAIMEQERSHFLDSDGGVASPIFMKEIIAEFTHLARRSPEINQRSGVSVRVSIANYETIMASALLRTIRLREDQAVPRISDLVSIVASTAGKIEMESVEEGREGRVIEGLTKKAVLNCFGRYFSSEEFEILLQAFDDGLVVDVGGDTPVKAYVESVEMLEGMREGLQRLDSIDSPAMIAAGVEFILEGLHLNKRLNRETLKDKMRYRA